MNEKYKAIANTVIKKMVKKANAGGMRENFGNKELRKFNDLINHTDDELSYADRAELSSYLSEKLSRIALNKEGFYYSE